MDYIRKEADGQLAFTQSTDYLKIPSCLYGFHNETSVTFIKNYGMPEISTIMLRFVAPVLMCYLGIIRGVNGVDTIEAHIIFKNPVRFSSVSHATKMA